MNAPARAGEVTLIEAAGRPAASLAWAGVQALRRADVVVADPRVHPGVLWHASTSAEVVLTPWDAEAAKRVVERSAAGASVVCVVESLDVARALGASGVEIRRISGIDMEPPLGPLRGRRILVTRPRDSATPQRDRFERLGADAVALPCLRIEPPADEQIFDAAVAGIADADGLIVSSRTGVAALTASLRRSELDVRSLATTLVVAVGQATARACAVAGLRADIVPTRPRAEGIVDALDQRGLLGKRWLHVRARDGRATIDEAVTRAGGQYTLAVGYQTGRPPPPAGVISWLGDGVDVICLHSGRTGAHLRATLAEAAADGVLETAAVISAGPVTTKALQEQGFEVALTASSPGDDGMVNAVLELFGAA
ncbi:MAG: uroporphyrinogen-III synthase [Nannocystaceae bacterium]|nr:uroporphyrinogen-III synthase [bacterium]